MCTFEKQWEKEHPKTQLYLSDAMCASFSPECQQTILTYMPSLIDLSIFSNSTFFGWETIIIHLLFMIYITHIKFYTFITL